MISRYFIERPVLANVFALVILLIGCVCLFRLPISQYPNVVPPTVQVTTTFPGADATTVARTVALPIEDQVNGVTGMLYMQSYSTDSGTYALTVTFQIGTDPDEAQVLVQNRVSAALASLPASVQTQGVVVEKQSTSILGFVALNSPDGSRDSLFLSNYATLSLQNELARLPGVGNVAVYGAGQYAMRIWMDPNQLTVRNLTASDVLGAIEQQSQVVPMGQLGGPPTPPGQAFQYTLNVTTARFDTPEEFGNIIVKSGTGAGGQIVRLRDVARVELGAQTYAQDFRLNGAPSTGIAISQDPEANALDVMREVKAHMATLARSFPQGVAYSVPFDTTLFVQASIDEVYLTLIETGLLVLVVILLFLQDWRAMMVPATTVPITIVGAFAAMAALGFSINISTLFALVLAIGIVVDDAIVIVEGATQEIEKGAEPRLAAERAMDRLFAPIVGITLVLMSVFVPAAFLPGLTGRMYAQFALVIAATALISALNAATLKPTQCALWLRRPTPPERRNFVFRGFNAVYAATERRYEGLIRRIVAHPRIMTALGLALLVGAGVSLSRLPTGFLPLEDQGYFLVAVQLPSGASLQRTQAVTQELSGTLKAVGGVETVVAVSGVSAPDGNSALANAGALYVVLKPWDQRGPGEDFQGMLGALTKAVAGIESAVVLVIPPPAIQGIGNTGGFTMQVELRGQSLDWGQLDRVTAALVRAANGQSGLSRVATTYHAGAPQYAIAVNRVQAETLQVAVQDIFAVLSTSLGSSYAGQFDNFGRTFQVYAENDGSFRTGLQQIENLRVRNARGEMVLLGSLLTITRTSGPSLVSLYNLYPSATVLGSPAPGFSSGDSIELMEATAARVLPPQTGTEWTAMSYQEDTVGNQIYFIFALALALVYLVLAGQYENWLTPFAVLLAVPLALVGPVATWSVLGLDMNLYSQIGLILLVALSAKNAILIVEYARELHADGRDLVDAATQAALARFRPILMTSIAFSLGVLPLVLATGAGANSRHAIGVTVLSGMLSSTLFAVVLVPAFFVLIQGVQDRRRGRKPAAADEGVGPVSSA